MDENSGWRVEICDGPSGCVNRVADDAALADAIREVLAERSNRSGARRPFVVAVSSCPNACSRPQIADLGVIGASVPEITNEPCILCMACVLACREGAVTVPRNIPLIDPARCVSCGQCARVCVPGTIVEGKTGYRVLLGGQLGRHPRLGEELPGIYTADGVLAVLGCSLDLWQREGRAEERFGETLARIGSGTLLAGIRERGVRTVQAPVGPRPRRRVTRGPAR